MTGYKKLSAIFWTLCLTYGILPIVAGLDKFTNLLVDWQIYLAPFAVQNLPVSPPVFMGIVGVIEIVAGLIVLGGAPRLGGWIVAIWLGLIAINLVVAGFYDIAVRDIVMGIGALCFAGLADVHERLEQGARIERVEVKPEPVPAAGAIS